jgi:hypothetical protein
LSAAEKLFAERVAQKVLARVEDEWIDEDEDNDEEDERPSITTLGAAIPRAS